MVKESVTSAALSGNANDTGLVLATLVATKQSTGMKQSGLALKNVMGANPSISTYTFASRFVMIEFLCGRRFGLATDLISKDLAEFRFGDEWDVRLIQYRRFVGITDFDET